MGDVNFTRGNGSLENFLAGLRAKKAKELLPSDCKGGKILDIGCGVYPFFLINSNFSEKYGLDKSRPAVEKSYLEKHDINFLNVDVEELDRLPFENDYFDVVSMLAVLEHIETRRLPWILKEIHRVLRRGGVYILTTPVSWTDPPMRYIAKLGLFSMEEVNDHKDTYDHPKINNLLQKSGFEKEKIRLGYFELFTNIWAVAEK